MIEIAFQRMLRDKVLISYAISAKGEVQIFLKRLRVHENISRFIILFFKR